MNQLLTLPLGPLQANCYILADAAGEALIIDPGGEPERILAPCRGLQPRLIVLTHGHVDHAAAARPLQQALRIPVLVHPADRPFVENPHPYFVQLVGGMEPCTPDGALEEGQTLAVGRLTLHVLHTPGHSPGSVCLQLDNWLFTGDTLFAGSVGRWDLPGGDWPTLAQSLRRLIAALPPETQLYPGHGPASSLAEELRTNPFLADL